MALALTAHLSLPTSWWRRGIRKRQWWHRRATMTCTHAPTGSLSRHSPVAHRIIAAPRRRRPAPSPSLALTSKAPLIRRNLRLSDLQTVGGLARRPRLLPPLSGAFPTSPPPSPLQVSPPPPWRTPLTSPSLRRARFWAAWATPRARASPENCLRLRCCCCPPLPDAL